MILSLLVILLWHLYFPGVVGTCTFSSDPVEGRWTQYQGLWRDDFKPFRHGSTSMWSLDNRPSLPHECTRKKSTKNIEHCSGWWKPLQHRGSGYRTSSNLSGTLAGGFKSRTGPVTSPCHWSALPLVARSLIRCFFNSQLFHRHAEVRTPAVACKVSKCLCMYY